MDATFENAIVVSMKIWTLVLLTGLLAGCVTTTEKSDLPDERYISVLRCADEQYYLHFQSNGYSVANLRGDVEAALSKCGGELDKYIEGVLTNTKQRYGWHSLDPAVRPAVEKRFNDQFVEFLIPVFKDLYGKES